MAATCFLVCSTVGCRQPLATPRMNTTRRRRAGSLFNNKDSPSVKFSSGVVSRGRCWLGQCPGVLYLDRFLRFARASERRSEISGKFTHSGATRRTPGQRKRITSVVGAVSARNDEGTTSCAAAATRNVAEHFPGNRIRRLSLSARWRRSMRGWSLGSRKVLLRHDRKTR